MGVFEHWPNRITAMRFVGAIVLFVLFSTINQGNRDSNQAVMCVSFWLFVVTAATDFLDGYLARRSQHVTAFGRIADPFTDKILIVGSMIYLAVLPETREWFPAWIVVVIVAREFLVTGIRGYVESIGGEFPADWFGKIKMIVQCVAVGAALWTLGYDWPDAWRTFWTWITRIAVYVTLLTTVASGLSYVLKTRKILAEASR